MKEVAIIGIQGLPAQYGGYETQVENMIGENQSPNVHYTIFNSSKDQKSSLEVYKGATMKYINLPSHGVWSIPYYTLSYLKSFRKFDTILQLGLAGGFFLPIFKLFNPKVKVIVNVDGIEHRRDKFNKFGKWLLLKLEQFDVKFADVIISDNEGIKEYVTNTYHIDSEVIAYGGDTAVQNKLPHSEMEEILARYNMKAYDYSFAVCRIEPENKCHMTLEAFSKTTQKIVFVGNWERSKYGHDLKVKYSKYDNITILDPIYDLDTLYAMRANAKSYIHGHSVGGTNPSLVEAMFFGRPVFCFDCIYNRFSTHDKASYYKNEDELLRLIENVNDNGGVLKAIAEKEYTWKRIAEKYESLY
jgi:glycosyltransferase involved in cell wall biosynthesis